jgi:hypothetical protein
MYLTIDSDTRKVTTNAPAGLPSVMRLASTAAAIMDAEQTGVRQSSLDAMLRLLEDHANMIGYVMRVSVGQLSGSMTHINFVDMPIVCDECDVTSLNDCLHM